MATIKTFSGNTYDLVQSWQAQHPYCDTYYLYLTDGTRLEITAVDRLYFTDTWSEFCKAAHAAGVPPQILHSHHTSDRFMQWCCEELVRRKRVHPQIP